MNISQTLYFIVFVFLFSGILHTSSAQVEVKNGIPFKDGGKILPGVENGQGIYALFNDVLKSSPAIPGVKLPNDYGQAWNAVISFFDKRFIYTETNEYFMMHGPYKGKICIVIYNTPEMRKVAENNSIFSSANSALTWYNKIKNQNNKEKIKEFDEKLGKLSGYFSDRKSLQQLQKYLGKELFNELMKTLRDELKHLIKGALIHEGMHAITNNAQALQEAFRTGQLPVELNELRAYMAEILYHAWYYNWAINNIDYHWNEIDNLLAELEKYRIEKPKEMNEKEKAEFEKNREKIEEIKARIKAHIAMIRVRLREVQASAKRMDDMMKYYLSNYTKPIDQEKNRLKNAEEFMDKIKGFAATCAKFREDVEQMAAAAEQWLKFLENLLDEWNKFSSCTRSSPPPQDTLRVDTVRKYVRFPAPPLNGANELKKKAEDEMKNYSLEFPEKGITNVFQYKDERRFSLTAGIHYSAASMNGLNNYFDYLNKTWNGNIPHINSGTGSIAGINYLLTKNISAGIEYAHFSLVTEGILQSVNEYRSENRMNAIMGNVLFRSNPLVNGVRFLAGFSAGPCFSYYSETENTYETKGNDSRTGWKTMAGTELMISPSFGFQVSGGYRNISYNDYGVSFFQPGNPPVSVDYSGITGEIKAVLKF